MMRLRTGTGLTLVNQPNIHAQAMELLAHYSADDLQTLSDATDEVLIEWTTYQGWPGHAVEMLNAYPITDWLALSTASNNAVNALH